MKNYLRLLGYVKAHIWVLVVAAVFMVLSSVLQPISISGLIPFIDKVMIGQDIVVPNQHVPAFITNLVSTINNTPSAKLLGIFIAFYIMMFSMRAVFIYCQQYLMREVSQRVVRDIRNLLYDKLLNLSMDFYAHSRTGTLVSRITFDSTIIQDAVSEGLTDLIWQSLQFILSLAMVIYISIIFCINPLFIVVVLFIMPLIVVPLIAIGRRLRQISKKSQESMAGINDILYESVSGIRIVKAFCMEAYERHKFRKQNREFKKMVMKSNKRILAVSPLTELITMVAAMIILWFGGKEVITGALSIGKLTAFSLLILSLGRPINRLSRVHNVNQQALAAASRIFELLDTEVAIEDKKDAIKLPAVKDEIVFSDISFKYTDKEVLRDISLKVKTGEIVAFVGPSGAGKTTLVSLIPRFYDTGKGAMLIDGCNVKDVSIDSLRNQIGIVTQETILFNDTVAANIAYGTFNKENMDKVIGAARTANAHNFIMKMPKQYETVIGERGFRLSGGEKQRLAIARAVFKNPPILIFDEATSQLDSESEKLVQEAIDRLMEGRTVFVIAHRLSTIKHADIIVVMNEGVIVDMGAHQELIDRGGLYKKLYNMQFASF
ncbi:MAG: ATP-binding cassette domain-containing protein [Candidatus Omnitrophica bacterium]|nr:ATP-binding cassette domain-containing protein [Candidatus Omnitrophota bacterium]